MQIKHRDKIMGFFVFKDTYITNESCIRSTCI